MFKHLWMIVLLCLGFPLAALGQQTPPLAVKQDPRLEEIARTTLEKFDLPGVCVAVLEGGRRVRMAAAGVRKAGGRAEITIDDRFHIGSCTKAMTATMIACVVRDTDLSWDSTVAEILPELAEQCHPDYRGVTLRQLLDHHGGVPANSLLMNFTDKKRSLTKQREQLLTGALEKEPKVKPGTRYEYSNLGYLLAALMAESVTGQSWEELMQQHVFDPLGMESAGFGPPAGNRKIDQPWGHHEKSGKHFPANIDNPPVLGPAGRVHCSLADWARFAALHMGHVPETRESESPAFTASMVEFLHQPVDDADYTFGWIVSKRRWAGGKALAHSGSNTVWYATIWIAPELDRAFLVGTNTGQKNADAACNAVIGELIAESRSKN